jgi:hypothetical protein
MKPEPLGLVQLASLVGASALEDTKTWHSELLPQSGKGALQGICRIMASGCPHSTPSNTAVHLSVIASLLSS